MSEPGPAQLADVLAIHQLKARYCRLLDEQRWEEWGALFTEDCDVAYGPGQGPYAGRARLVTAVSRGLTGATTIHHATMPEIEIRSPTTASGLWAMDDRIIAPEGAAVASIQGWGHYREQYRRDADGPWRIAALRLTRLRVEPLPRR